MPCDDNFYCLEPLQKFFNIFRLKINALLYVLLYCQSFFKISNNILLSIAASVGSPRDMTTEEMRKLLERNEIVGGGGGKGLLFMKVGLVDLGSLGGKIKFEFCRPALLCCLDSHNSNLIFPP